jgi:hypothetical protein
MIYLGANLAFPPESGLPIFSCGFINQRIFFNVTWLRLTPVLAYPSVNLPFFFTKEIWISMKKTPTQMLKSRVAKILQ